MIATLDHVGYAGGELEALGTAFTRLGFTTGEPHEVAAEDAEGDEPPPLAQRSALVTLKAGHIELMTLRRRAASAAPGCRLVCFGADDLEAAYARCLAAGLHVSAPARATRALKQGKRIVQAPFRWFALEPDESPEGRVCFVHHEPSADAALPEEPAQHANGALGLDELCIVASDLATTAARYGRVLGIEPERSAGEALFRLLRGALRICERSRFEQLHGAALAVPADRFGFVALRVRDLAIAGRALQANRVPYRAAESAAYVPAANAAGAALALRRGR
jgi:catechol 2,3-dioxygenase-like lactoylglutathione lyase family enzyme